MIARLVARFGPGAPKARRALQSDRPAERPAGRPRSAGRSRQVLKLVLATVTGSLAVLAIASSLLASRYQKHIADASRYNGAFDFSQAAVEFLRLEIALQDVLLGEGDGARVAMRFDILRNRLGVIEGNRLLADAERDRLLAELRAALLRTEPRPGGDGDAAAARAALEAVRPLLTPVLQLAPRAHSQAGDDVYRNQRELPLIFAGICAVTLALVLFGAWLVIVVLRQNGRLDRVVQTDMLTGLPNRLAFNRAVKTADGPQRAVVLVDVDQFKAVNDTLGHPAGDRFLVEMAERLKPCAADAAVLARIGGDEFALLYCGPDAGRQSLDAARAIVAAAAGPLTLDGRNLAPSVTVGVSQALSGGDAATLFNDADIALYAGKAAGRGRFMAFEPAMRQTFLRRQRLTQELRHAVARGELSLVYQPIVENGTGETRGFEALLRWRHPELGLVSPGEFVPVAEGSGQIGAIGAFVIEAACREAAGWPEGVFVSVNVSARQLTDAGLAAHVRACLAANGLDGGRLVIEITETALIDNDAAALAALHALKGLGCRIALDDFGTGYASLSYLCRFPFDKLKIDRSFLGASGENVAIIAMICALGRQLGLEVVAEGIETEAQRDLVQGFGCRFGQGYWFDRPLDAATARGRLARENAGALRPPERDAAFPTAMPLLAYA